MERDPFEDTSVTVASTPSEQPGAELSVECAGAAGRPAIRFRLVDERLDRDPDADPPREMLFKVDALPTVTFERATLVQADDAAGGVLVVDPDAGFADSSAARLLDELASGRTLYVKARAGRGDVLRSFSLAGSAQALDAPLQACGRATPDGRGAGFGRFDARADGSRADVSRTDVSRTDVSRTDAFRGAVPDVSAEEMRAASAALPRGVTMDGLIDNLDDAFAASGSALERVSDASSARSALPALRDAGERFDRFAGVFRRLPEAARAPLARIVARRTDRLAPLVDGALASPGAEPELTPVLRPMLDRLDDLSRP